MLSVERFDGPVWEPACGNGAISKVLQDTGHQVHSTDLIQREFGQGGIDFLKTTEPLAKHIITNPPYGKHGLADAFTRKALQFTQQTRGKVALLLNLRSLCHPDRHPKFCKTPPAAIYALDALICWPNGENTSHSIKKADQQYCWMVWKPEHTGRPEFWWLKADAFKTPQDR